MSTNVPGPPKLPALRRTAEGRYVIENEVPLDLAASNSFSVSYASGSRSNQLSAVHTSPPVEWIEPPVPAVQEAASPISTTRSEVPPSSTNDSFLRLPQFSRSASMPLASQLTQLQHPHKAARRFPAPASASGSPSSGTPEVEEISYELADSIQMVVQTLLQVSPPQILDITKEQFSACSLSVPTSSMSAMFTVMKNINYLSANMSSYFGQMPPIPTTSRAMEKQPMQNNDENHMEFDVGEVLQCVGDSLSGTAAQVGVDLVIYHGDVSLKHVNVVGDEAGLSYAISHVIRQILNVAERGDTVELGLLLVPVGPTEGDALTPSEDIPLQCTLRIGHRFAFPERLPNEPYGPEPQQVRRPPNFSALLLRRILRQTNGTLISDLPPSEKYASGRTVELSFPLRRPRSTLSTPFDEHAIPEDPQYHHDPTLRQLVLFAETLKGKKATLYASPDACFAQHLTSYLTAWGMEVAHVSPDGNTDGAEASDTSSPPMEGVEGGSIPSNTTKTGEPEPLFVFIDDDVDVLRDRLLAQRNEHNAIAANQALRKRPALSSLHRPRSTINIPSAPNQKVSSVVIMHFTSLSNYKHLKDMVQTTMAGYSAATIPLPEVMILPKPAGPRRFLTALHTAATKPSVDLPFLPIATSPASPGLHHGGSFFSTFNSSNKEPSLPKVINTSQQPVSPNKSTRPAGTRSNSDRSVASNPPSESNSAVPITPSPLSLPENVEYFASAAQQLGSTPSSGMVVQSPDGQPAGILFRPKARTGTTAGSSSGTATAAGTASGTAAATPTGTASASPAGTVTATATGAAAAATTGATATPDSRRQATLAVPATRRPATSRPSSNAENAPTSFSALFSAPIGPSPTPPRWSPLDDPVDGMVAAATLAMHASPSTLASKKDKVPSPVVTSPKSAEASKPVSPSSPSGRVEGPGGIRRRNQRKLTQSDKESGPSKKPKHGDDIIPPISVLIVDDNPINQTILSTFMKRKKIKYDIANNGAEAVNKWKTGGFHLILMDIQMPVMDGIQATKEIRKMEKANAMAGFPPLTPTGGEVPTTPSEPASEGRAMPSPYRSSVIIVALTASSLQSDRDAALAAGCNDFLTKPVSLLWLNNKIIEWGSIKALQVWADIRPDVTRMNAGQALQAKAVADRLAVPRGRKTPSPTPRRTSSLNKEEGAAALALASSASSFKNPGGKGSSATAERLAGIDAPTMSSRSSSSKSSDRSPDGMSSSGELPPVRKNSLTSKLAKFAADEPVPIEQDDPGESTATLASELDPTHDQDVNMEAQELSNPDELMSSPEKETTGTQKSGDDYDMGDPSDDKSPLAGVASIPVSSSEEASTDTPVDTAVETEATDEPPPPLGIDREQ